MYPPSVSSVAILSRPSVFGASGAFSNSAVNSRPSSRGRSRTGASRPVINKKKTNELGALSRVMGAYERKRRREAGLSGAAAERNTPWQSGASGSLRRGRASWVSLTIIRSRSREHRRRWRKRASDPVSDLWGPARHICTRRVLYHVPNVARVSFVLDWKIEGKLDTLCE